jgi:hypothetical protein
MEEAVALARTQGNPSSLSFALMAYGLHLNLAEQYPQAIPVLEEAVAVGIEVGNQQGVASALNGFGFAQAQLGDHRAALGTYLEGLALQVRLGEHFTLDVTLLSLASCFSALHDFESSATLHGRAETISDYHHLGSIAELREASIAACSLALGTERYEELQSRGAAMSDDETLAFVRDASRPLLE